MSTPHSIRDCPNCISSPIDAVVSANIDVLKRAGMTVKSMRPISNTSEETSFALVFDNPATDAEESRTITQKWEDCPCEEMRKSRQSYEAALVAA